MHLKTIAASAGLLLLVGFSAAVSAAPVKEFQGTRAEVRAYCTGEDRHLLEGGSYSLCITASSDVICKDDGVCASSDLALALADGFQRETVAELATTGK